MATERRAQVVRLLGEARSALDDDEIAARLAMNRHYVNQICRQLAAEGLIRREPGRSGKLVNLAVDEGRARLSPEGSSLGSRQVS